MKVFITTFLSLFALSVAQPKLARCAGQLKKCTMYKMWNWDSCMCVEREQCDMKCPEGKNLNPEHKCKCSKLWEIIPTPFRKNDNDGIGQCGNNWYWIPEADMCVSYAWCPSWNYCGPSKTWDSKSCSCVESTQLPSKKTLKTELDKQCGRGFDWSALQGRCFPSSGRLSSDDELEVFLAKDDSYDDEDVEIDPDQDLSEPDNDVKCPRGWNWSSSKGRCRPPGSLRSRGCREDQWWDGRRCANDSDNEEGDGGEVVCPFGYRINGRGDKCINRCQKGQRWVEKEVGVAGTARTRKIKRCQWRNNIKCKKSMNCGIGKYKGIRNGKCRCLKVKNFKPGNICGRNKTWNERKYRCVRRKSSTCPLQTRKCSYGKAWSTKKCSCTRQSWCPVTKSCRHGKYYHNKKCKCLRHDWCPARKVCLQGERWDNKKCQCKGRGRKECPEGQKWDSQEEHCDYTRSTCYLLECPARKRGTWYGGQCRCKTKKGYCDRMSCPTGKRPRWTDGEQCECRRITGFRPTEDICGPGERWSKRQFRCKSFKGCGPGRKWSSALWKCTGGAVQCPAGTTWSYSQGACIRKTVIIAPVVRCPSGFVWTDADKCMPAQTTPICQKNYRCTNPMMSWDPYLCKCALRQNMGIPVNRSIPVNRGIPVNRIGMTCPANQKRHLITKQCVCKKFKTRCHWDSQWSEVECECKKRDMEWITTTRRRSIETDRVKWMMKYEKP